MRKVIQQQRRITCCQSPYFKAGQHYTVFQDISFPLTHHICTVCIHPVIHTIIVAALPGKDPMFVSLKLETEVISQAAHTRSNYVFDEKSCQKKLLFSSLFVFLCTPLSCFVFFFPFGHKQPATARKICFQAIFCFSAVVLQFIGIFKVLWLQLPD